jgi:uncharacterized membrane protein
MLTLCIILAYIGISIYMYQNMSVEANQTGRQPGGLKKVEWIRVVMSLFWWITLIVVLVILWIKPKGIEISERHDEADGGPDE